MSDRKKAPKKTRKDAQTPAAPVAAAPPAINLADEKNALSIYAAKMSTLADMAGGIAHEINTPLAVILTLASQIREMLEDGDVDKEVFIEGMNTIEKTTVKIADIISGLRTFARDGMKDDTVQVEVRKLLDDTMSLCRERFVNRGVRLEFIIPNPALVVECNSAQISQVILNVLQNCHDALMKVANRWIRIEIQEREAEIEISITDSGDGIPKQHYEQIFRPFFTTKEVGQGPGLGLSVSRSIMENHGGTLILDEKSANTKFVLTLPKRAKLGAAS